MYIIIFLKILELKRAYEAGTWKYNISVPPEDTGKTAVVIVHLNVKPNGITLQGFLNEPAMLHSVKGNETKVVKAYAFLRNMEENGVAASYNTESNIRLSDIKDGQYQNLDYILIF